MLSLNGSPLLKYEDLYVTEKLDSQQRQSKLIDVLDLAGNYQKKSGAFRNLDYLDLASNQIFLRIPLSKFDLKLIKPNVDGPNTNFNKCVESHLLQSIKTLTKRLTLTNTLTILCLTTYALTNIPGNNLLYNGALNISQIWKGQVWRIATSPILHFNNFHLLLNIWNLRSIGPLVEKRWGASGFAKIVALSIIADVLAKAALKSTSWSVGFSGAIYGMVGAYHVVKTPKKWFALDLTSCFKLWALDGILGIIMESTGVMRIDHVAHLSGYVAGLTFGWLSNKT